MNEKTLSDEAREARNRYLREYRARNKEKVKEINRRYWEKKALKEADEHAETGRNE